MVGIKEDFAEFYQGYGEEGKNAIWQEHSQTFHSFWQQRIMSGTRAPNDAEIDEIVRLLDKKGKGNSPGDEAVAKVMVPQGAWRRMFNHFSEQKSLRNAMNLAISAPDPEGRAKAIDEIYKCNTENKNNLTGKTGSAISAFLALSNPMERLSIVSLKDRALIMGFLGLDLAGLDEMTTGEKVVRTENVIMEYFKANRLTSNARTISVFLYAAGRKEDWRSGLTQDSTVPEIKSGTKPAPAFSDEQLLFYMESQLEDFLVENWDKTELGKKYALIEENGDLVSQQYKTDIGIIDILAKEKGTDTYVVIELKRNQTSDDTVGQIARYMGWIDEHRAKTPNTRGVIIAGKYDDKLNYALKKIKDVEVFIYKVDFQLEEHKR